jgi:acetyl esterase/lipase
MASLASKAFIIFLKLINKKSFLKKQFDYGKFDFYTSPKPPQSLSKKYTVEKRTIHERNVFTIRPKHHPTNKHILYLHGGAYVQNFVRQHWTFIALLIDTLHCTVHAPDYPLAPKHSYKEAFAMVIPLYKELIHQVQPSNLILMGDSAGGGFALALAQHLKTKNIPQPSQIFLLSPWLDITLKNPEILTLDLQDPFLGIEGLRRAGMTYAGNSDPESYMLSPINGTFEGLAKIHLFIGTRDILVADARKLKLFLQEKEINMHYHEYGDMIHVWMLLNFPESKMAQREIIQLIKEA